MRISKNFSLHEFTDSDTANKFKIDNTQLTEETLINITSITCSLLQPLRDSIGRITINSGFRCEKLNSTIGGSISSKHLNGSAVDIECELSTIDFANYIINSGLDYDKLILEFYKPERGSNSGWVHLSFDRLGNNRKINLTTSIVNGNLSYIKYVV